MKFRTTILLLFFSAVSLQTEAGMNKWTKDSDPRAGKFNVLVNVPLSWGNAFFGGTQDSGVFRSTDGGETWLQVCQGKPQYSIFDIEYQITPEQTTIFIVSASEGVFKTTNFGSTCEEIPGLPSKEATSLAIAPNGNLYAALYGQGVYVSVDKGQNWSEMNNELTKNAYHLAVDSGGNIYVATWGEGVFKYTAGSSIWQSLSAGAPTPEANRVLVIDEQGVSNVYGSFWGSGVSKWVNGTWVPADQGLPPKSTPTALEKDKQGRLYLSFWNGELYTKPEGGEVWNVVPNDGSRPMSIFGFDIGDQGEWLMAAYGAGIHQCDPGAQNCRQVFFLNDANTVELFVSSDGKIISGSDSGPFLLDSDGKHWIPYARREGEVGTGYVYHMSEFAEMLFISSYYRVHRSDDRGLTWKRSDKGLEKKYNIRIHSCRFGAQDLLFATTNDGIFKSDDGGWNWRDVSTGLTDKSIRSMGCLPAQPLAEGEPPATGIVVAGNEGGGHLSYSSDSGETWQEVINELSKNRSWAFACNPSGSACYASTLEGFVYKTIDRGESWQQCTPLEVSMPNRDLIIDGEEIFVEKDGGYVFHSTDGCQSWTRLGAVLPTDLAWALALQKVEKGSTLRVGTFGEGNYQYSLQTCGNGKKEFEETCDDGNQEAGDGCTELCQIEDDDKDGIANPADNCSQLANAEQIDTDQDGLGDACDEDDDGDGLLDDADNCIAVVNEDQLDVDGDGSGDLCDDDRDGDEAVDETDNCKLVQNKDQLDTDNDGLGDVCDDDKDGDNYLDLEDNCPLMVNADQLDSDQDKLGDLCDETPQPIVDEGGDELALLEGEAGEKALPTPPDPETGFPMPGPSKESSGETAQAGGTSGGDNGGGGGSGAAGCSLMIGLENKIPFDYSLWTPVLILIFLLERAVLVKSHRSACRRNG